MCRTDSPSAQIKIHSILFYKVESERLSVSESGRLRVTCGLTPQTGLQQYSFLVFLVVCSGAGAYIFFVIPETKGKTFLEIHQEFQTGNEKEKSRGETIFATPL